MQESEVMRLALQTDYALRTLMYLASVARRTTVDDVATLFGISANHVAKVVNQLSRLGWIRSIRGLGGGIELAVPADCIRLGDVVLAFEGNLHLLECVGVDNVCAIEDFCSLKSVLRKAEQLQIDYLNSLTLQDVVPSKRRLQQVAAHR
jgi:Rrf2 family nitric oxide-sensitive transcriptional repressor